MHRLCMILIFTCYPCKKFNHCSSGRHEVEISYDEEGSATVYAATDIPAGEPLRMSYGDYYLTNPSATFAKYGFIDESAQSTFCKMMDIVPSTELRDIGLSYSRMLFYNTGEVSEVCMCMICIVPHSHIACSSFYLYSFALFYPTGSI